MKGRDGRKKEEKGRGKEGEAPNSHFWLRRCLSLKILDS